MPSILDFFKPVRKNQRPLEDESTALTSEPSSVVAPTPPRSSSDTHRKLRKIAVNKATSQSMTQDAAERPRKRQAAMDSAAIVQNAPPVSASVPSPEQPVELSQYEQKRLTKMAANAKFLQELGITSAQLEMTGQLQPDRTSKTKRRSRPKPLLEKIPVRRSRRLRGHVALTSSRVKEDNEEVASDKRDPSQLEYSFAESNVFRYSVNEDHNTRKIPLSSTLDNTDGELVGFQVDPTSYLSDHSLTKTYDISFTSFQENGLIATGGHGGLVSIFAFSNSYHYPETVDEFVEDSDTQTPLMSFKAHSGWVSAISLARSIQGKANLLLTASNDASVKLWDLNHSSTMLQTPKEVCTSTNLHQKGIFGMDLSGNSVLTCSKDATVVFSQFREDTGPLEVTQRFNEHEGVVKCVRFAQCNPQLFASGGNNRKLRVFDMRVAGNSNVVTISDVHSRAINSVQFYPCDDNLLLSAGFDPDFYMFDMRNTSTPVCVFHQQKDTSKAIFHPIFVRNGRAVVTARGRDLSLYRTSDGMEVSRGYLDDAATCISADPFHDRIAIAQGGKLAFADAKWENKGR